MSTKRYSSLDLIQYANIGVIALFTITLSWEIYKYSFDPVRILNIANFLLAWFIFVKIRTLKGFLHRVNVLLDQASRGDLEHRLVKEKEGGELGQMALHLNYFLDVVEGFIREIIMPLKYAGERKYWRKKDLNNITERLSRIRDKSQKTVGVAREGRESAGKIVFELNGLIKTVESYAHVVEELAQKAGSVTS